MNLLLDTHAFLWFIHDDPRLSDKARVLLMDMDNACFVSMASIWEMAIKSSLGKLTMPLPISQLYQRHILANDMQILPINLDHMQKIHDMPFYHKDPFDRMIIAQALIDDMVIIGRDGIYQDYLVKHAW